MATTAQIEARIDQIDEILAAGVKSVSTDGTSTSVDLAALRKERADLLRRLTNTQRPVAMRWNLGGSR